MGLENTIQPLVQQEIALDTYLSKLLDDIPTDVVLDQLEEKKKSSGY